MFCSSGVKSPRDVLSFWFSEEAYFGDQRDLMSSVDFMKEKSKSQWYAGTKADASCMPFVATIEAAASGALDGGAAPCLFTLSMPIHTRRLLCLHCSSL